MKVRNSIMSEEKTTGAVAPKTRIETELSNTTNKYMQIIKNQMDEGGAEFDAYSGKCVMSAMGAINNLIHGKGKALSELNTSNVNEILIKVATLKLNANAVPRECYFQTRSVNVGGAWETQIEFGIEGDGNDAILARFGRDVKKVCQHWLVRSGDKFTYPKFNGLEMTAPQWEPTGQGEVIRVVYPIIKIDNTVEYYIAERRDVIKNLYAHISNNLMNETFGFVTGTKKDKNGKSVERTRYDATDEEKGKIAAKKKEILNIAKSLNDLDKILDSEELAPYISPAWKELQSREEMIIRKMRNNVVKKIPKDFGSTIAAEQYNMMDDTYKEIHAEIEENANSVVFDSDYKEVEKPQQIEEKQTVEQPQPEPSPQEEKVEKAEEKQNVEQSQPEPQEEAMEMPDWMKPQ